MKNKKILMGAIGAAAGMLATTVSAETLVMAGAEGGSGDHYAYIGAVMPFAGSTLGTDGWRVRAWVYTQEFNYDRSTISDVEADGEGVELSLGHRWTIDSTVLTTYLGIAYRDIDTSPNDKKSSVDGSNTGIKGQLEIEQPITENISLSFNGSYTGGDDFDDTWVQVRTGYKMSDTLTVGPELTYMNGTDDFEGEKIGLFIDGLSLGNINVGLSAGAQGGDSEGAYVGVSLSSVF